MGIGKANRKEAEVNKAELINTIYNTGNYTSRANAQTALEDILTAVTTGINNDGKVQIEALTTRLAASESEAKRLTGDVDDLATMRVESKSAVEAAPAAFVTVNETA